MKPVVNNIEQPARTFLKSTSHLRVRETSKNYARSIAVGLQFGVIYLPFEIVNVVLVPFFSNFIHSIYHAIDSLIFVISAAIEAYYLGFTGKLEAVDEPIPDSYDAEE